MKYFFQFILFCSCWLFFSCGNADNENNNQETAQDQDYITLKFPPFETVKIVSLDTAVFNSITNQKSFDSLVHKNILRGSPVSYTFLDSLGNPLSKYYDSLILNSEQASLLVNVLGRCYAKDNPGFPKCGKAIADAVVFYNKAGKPCGFIQIGFACHVYEFSQSLNINADRCNTDSMMKKFVSLFNSFGIHRTIAY